MKKSVKWIAGGLVAIAGVVGLTGCQSDAHRVSDNLSTEAEQFRITRDIVFYNGITDKYMFEIKGRCSVDDSDALSNTLAVTCKIDDGDGSGSYVKEYLGKSDNVAWFSVQTKPSQVSPYHYEIIFKPQNIIPSFTGSDSADQ